MQEADHLAHCGTKRGAHAGGRRNIQQPKEGVQETNADGMVEGDMDFIGNLEVGGSEDDSEAETHSGTTRTPGSDEDF